MPEGHIEHVLDPLNEKKPTGHDKQDSEPVGEYFPAAHSAQDTLPAVEYVPSGHKSHVLPSPAALDHTLFTKNPAGQTNDAAVACTGSTFHAANAQLLE